MLLRFVQALYFARSCKELIRANLALDARPRLRIAAVSPRPFLATFLGPDRFRPSLSQALVVKLSALILAATGALGFSLHAPMCRRRFI